MTRAGDHRNTQMRPDDRQLLLRTRRGDDAAARQLWARFAPRMLAYARTILGTRTGAADSADDVVQSVFLSILRIPARQVRAIDDVPAWMLRLTRNAALNHLRAIRRERCRRADLASAHPRPVQSPASIDDAPHPSTIALAALPRRHRELLVLKHIAGLTFDQLALALSINRNTAASRYRAALTLLRQSLETPPEPCGRNDNHA